MSDYNDDDDDDDENGKYDDDDDDEDGKGRLGCAGHLKRLECKIYTPPPHQLHNTFQDNCYSNDDVYDENADDDDNTWIISKMAWVKCG